MAFSIKKVLEVTAPAEFSGDEELMLESPATLVDAGIRDISFFGSPKYKDQVSQTKAGCLLIDERVKGLLPASYQGQKIFVKNVVDAWRRVLELWAESTMEKPWGIDPAAVVSRTVKLGKNVSIGAMTIVEDRVVMGDGTLVYPQCYIGRGVTIGRGAVIYPQVVIQERCVIGDHVVIHSGTVIGADGFGFVTVAGRHRKVPQIGSVEIGHDVEIGANCTIDRATVGWTKIGEGTKMDDAVHIAHNVVIGKGCLFAAQVGIAGSTTIGDYVVFGGQVGVADHVEIAGGTMAGGQSGIISDVKEKDILWGTPARNHRETLRLQALYGKLPEMNEVLKKLDAALNDQQGSDLKRPKNTP